MKQGPPERYLATLAMAHIFLVKILLHFLDNLARF